jgi:solute carrier family 25 carnitine/acylcarnitine transporter 20/29
MASPLVGIAAVNGLLFGAYMRAKKVMSPYPVLTITQTAGAGAIAGAINSILASPVEMFKIRMQGVWRQALFLPFIEVAQLILIVAYEFIMLRSIWCSNR